MAHTYRSYVGLGSLTEREQAERHFDIVGPVETRLTLTAFAGPEGSNRRSVQFTLGDAGRAHVGLHAKKVEAVVNALQNRVAVKANGEGTATPLRVRPNSTDRCEMLLSLGVPDGYDWSETGSYIALTEAQTEDLAESLQARLDGDDWVSSTASGSFYCIDEDGEQTEMHEPGITVEQHEREQEEGV